MTIQQLIDLTENRLRHFETQRSSSYSTGDAAGFAHFQSLVDQTIATLEALKTLLK